MYCLFQPPNKHWQFTRGTVEKVPIVVLYCRFFLRDHHRAKQISNRHIDSVLVLITLNLACVARFPDGATPRTQ